MNPLAELNVVAEIDAQKAIIAAAMESPLAYDLASAAGLTPDDMFGDSDRMLYAAIRDSREAGKHVDTITIASELRERKQLENVGGLAYLYSLPGFVPVCPSIRTYVQKVRDAAKKRRLINACEATAGAAYDGGNAQGHIETLKERLLQIETDSQDPPAERVLKFTDQVLGEWERMADSPEGLIGLTTGVECVDLVTTGIRPGELWLLAGRTGDGKSSVALQAAAENCRADIPVGLFSIEMSKADVLQRLWAQQGNIPFSCIRNPRGIGKDMRLRIQRAATDVAMWPLFVVEDGAITLQRLLAKARLMIRQERVRLLIVDYMQLVSVTAKEERERLTKISNALRSLAKETGVPVLAISQLSRPKDGNQNQRPNKFSLKESGSLENDAHVIVMAYRPVDQCGQPTGEDELIIAKQRHGPVSNERVYFDSKTLTFRERCQGTDARSQRDR